MSLITCKECGKEISDTAKQCPNCGYAFEKKKFCKFCGEKIDNDCIICPKCGKQIEQISNSNIIVNNNNSASSIAVTPVPTYHGREKNKWVSLLLCIFTVCGHKFYEGKPLMGLLYLFTVGFCGVGWVIDIITLALKPNPYYV